MPETRYNRIEHYDQQGNLLSVEEIPYEVSDKELAKEANETTLKKFLSDPHSGLPDLEAAFQALARLYLGEG